jgi:hypothetical protein
MRNWLLFGAGLGVYAAISIFVTTDGNLIGALVGIALGIAVGTVGGIVQVLLPRDHEPDSLVVGSRTRVLIALAVILVAAGSVVRIANGPPGLYLVLIGSSIVLFVVASRIKKQGQ